jgi:hypothetical protein
MVVVLSVALAIVTCIAAVAIGLVVLNERWHREQLEMAQEKARFSERARGVDEHWRVLEHVRELLARPEAVVPQRWSAAFALLFPVPGCSWIFDGNAAAAQLLELGYQQEQVTCLVEWRLRQPYVLLAMLTGVLAAVPDEHVWKMATAG